MALKYFVGDRQKMSMRTMIANLHNSANLIGAVSFLI